MKYGPLAARAHHGFSQGIGHSDPGGAARSSDLEPRRARAPVRHRRAGHAPGGPAGQPAAGLHAGLWHHHGGAQCAARDAVPVQGDRQRPEPAQHPRRGLYFRRAHDDAGDLQLSRCHRCRLDHRQSHERDLSLDRLALRFRLRRRLVPYPVGSRPLSRRADLSRHARGRRRDRSRRDACGRAPARHLRRRRRFRLARPETGAGIAAGAGARRLCPVGPAGAHGGGCRPCRRPGGDLPRHLAELLRRPAIFGRLVCCQGLRPGGFGGGARRALPGDHDALSQCRQGQRGAPPSRRTRWADAAFQSAPFRRAARRSVAARQPIGPGDVGDHDRYRLVQELQRHLWPPGRRSLPARRGAGPGRRQARSAGFRQPLRRRGVRRVGAGGRCGRCRRRRRGDPRRGGAACRAAQVEPQGAGHRQRRRLYHGGRGGEAGPHHAAGRRMPL